MTIFEVVINSITTYQLSYQYRSGMKLCWCCCCSRRFEVTSPKNPIDWRNSQQDHHYFNPKIHFSGHTNVHQWPDLPHPPLVYAKNFCKKTWRIYQILILISWRFNKYGFLNIFEWMLEINASCIFLSMKII